METVETFEEKNDKRQLAVAWHSVVEVHMAQGDREEAFKAVEDEQSVIQDSGDQSCEAGVQLYLATVQMRRGSLDAALTAASEAIDIYQGLLKHRQGEAITMNKRNFGWSSQSTRKAPASRSRCPNSSLSLSIALAYSPWSAWNWAMKCRARP